MKKTFNCKRIGVSVIGFEIPHAHIHLIPINHIDDMDFNNKKVIKKHELKLIAKKISKEINLST